MSDAGQKPDFEKLLQGAGLRITQPRRAILAILAASDDHPDAAEIYARAVKQNARVSLATVYRTVKVLEDSGAIQRHAFGNGPARFEQAQSSHHDHLIDVDTGEITEFTSARIEAIQEEVAERLGFEIVYHKLELYGRRKKPVPA